MRLTARQMEIIYTVNLYGSVTEAATVLGISQPAVSQILRDCSVRSGFPFFIHRHGRLQATQETLAIVEGLAQVIESIEQVNWQISQMHGAMSGTLRVATSATLADNLVAPASGRFHRKHPKAQIAVQAVYDNISILESVHQGLVDFGIIFSPLLDRDGNQIEARLIDVCAVDLVCITPLDCPLSARSSVRPRDLLAFPLVSFDRHLPLGALIEATYRREGVTRTIAVEVTSTSMAYSMVRAGSGVAVVDPIYQLSHEDDTVATIRFEPRTEVKVQILLPTKAVISRMAKLFVKALHEEGELLLSQVAGSTFQRTSEASVSRPK